MKFRGSQFRDPVTPGGLKKGVTHDLFLERERVRGRFPLRLIPSDTDPAPAPQEEQRLGPISFEIADLQSGFYPALPPADTLWNLGAKWLPFCAQNDQQPGRDAKVIRRLLEGIFDGNLVEPWWNLVKPGGNLVEPS